MLVTLSPSHSDKAGKEETSNDFRAARLDNMDKRHSSVAAERSGVSKHTDEDWRLYHQLFDTDCLSRSMSLVQTHQLEFELHI